VNDEIKNPSGNTETKKKKLLDRFKIRVSDREFTIEIYNQDLSDDTFKKYSIVVNGTPYSVEVESLGIDTEIEKKDIKPIAEPIRSKEKTETHPPVAERVDTKPEITSDKPSSSIVSESFLSDKVLTAPMPGKILEIKIKVGDSVEAGEPLLILEAMKMENVMTAPASGTVKEIPIQVGVNVNQGEKLVIIE
jgi:glutaconyl-CoA decarboxylase